MSVAEVKRILPALALGVAAFLVQGQFGGVAAQPSEILPAVAEITIPNPRSASLLQLQGYSGSGTALFRIDGVCSRMDVRFVAGNFLGNGVSASRAAPVRLRITDEAAVRKLHRGRDLVSEDLNGDAAGIEVVSGLAPETGFVINAGASLLADVFGADVEPFPCPVMSATGRFPSTSR